MTLVIPMRTAAVVVDDDDYDDDDDDVVFSPCHFPGNTLWCTKTRTHTFLPRALVMATKRQHQRM